MKLQFFISAMLAAIISLPSCKETHEKEFVEQAKENQGFGRAQEKTVSPEKVDSIKGLESK
jgi:hypothetical protein